MKLILTEKQLHEVTRALIKEAITMPSPEVLKVAGKPQKYFYKCHDTQIIDKILNRNGWELTNLIENNENSFTYYMMPKEYSEPTPFSEVLKSVDDGLNAISDTPLEVSEGKTYPNSDEISGLHSIEVFRDEEFKNQFNN